MAPRISLRITTYKQAQPLGQAIRNALQQPYCPLKLPAWCSIQISKFALSIASISLVGAIQPETAFAQAIAPANDGINTVITPAGNQFNITGGTVSGDGTNLFHSFEQFGLTQGQIANFLANPQLQNILGRVVGNNPSVIDGLIQVTGGAPNLYLLNPAGIVFGPNARLNVPSSFTATTANAIAFGCGSSNTECQWFSATGANNYSTFLGNPNGFGFNTPQPGAIVNAGVLTVQTGKTLALVGGTVVNTGQLNASDGQLLISAVPGGTFARLNQPGNLLSLEFQPISPNSALPSASTSAPTLAQLLTGGNLGNATGLTVNPNGTVSLTGSNTTISTAAGTTITSGSLNTTGSTGGTIAIVGQQVNLIGASLDASGANSGGKIYIGGDYQGKGTLPTAQQTYISPNSVIDASAKQNGQGGTVIAWADKFTAFRGTIRARGGANSGDGGLVEVSGKQTLKYRGTVDTTAPNGQAGTLLLDPLNIIITGNSPGANDDEINDDGQISFADGGSDSFTISQESLQSAASSTGNIVLQAANAITFENLVDGTLQLNTEGPGSFTLQAGGAITMNAADQISGAGWTITIQGGSLSLGAIDTSGNFLEDGGNVTLTATGGDISFRTINTQGGEVFTAAIPTNGGAVNISAKGQVRGTDILESGSTIATQGVSGGSGGPISITHDGGPTNQSFVVGAGGAISATSGNGTAGALNAGGSDVISSGSFDFPSSPYTLPGSKVQITFLNDTPTVTATEAIPNTVKDQPVNLSAASLGITPQDLNNDVLSIRVASIEPGATLLINGVAAAPGTLIPSDATIQYIPPTGFVGVLANAFSITADDVISTSAPRAIALNISGGSTGGNPNDTPSGTVNTPCVLTTCQPTNLPPLSVEPVEADVLLPDLPEARFTATFADYLGLELPRTTFIEEHRTIAQEIEKNTGAKPAFIYVSFVPAALRASSTSRPNTNLYAGPITAAQNNPTIFERDNDQLEVIVVTATGSVLRKRLPEATRSEVMPLADELRQEVADPRKTRSTNYLSRSQQLYQWLVAPIQNELKLRKITNLVFLMDAGLRSLPVAALHDGQSFLIEQYSIGLMPSVSLTDTRYRNIKDSRLLSLGISESTQGQIPLPSVQLETATIVNSLWSGQLYLNENATIETLKSARQQRPFGIVHLATHADFLPGSIDNSYIQFWEERLRLDQLRELGLSNPQVQLLVLSACSTALGDRDAELGFGGLAVQAGVKSAVASLWSVNDVATSALITRFYKDLGTAPIKAEALRQTQLAILRGEVYVKDRKIEGIDPTGIALPEDVPGIRDEKLSHPYYWSGFTMIGNPW